MASGSPVCPACRKPILGKEEVCPHCKADLFLLLQAIGLFEEALERGAFALSRRDFKSAYEWLVVAEFWRPRDNRAQSLDALWADYYYQMGDYDRAAEVAAHADLDDRKRYEALRDASMRAREWASWSLHLAESGLYRSAEYALRQSRAGSTSPQPLQAMLDLFIDLKRRGKAARARAHHLLESSLPGGFLKWLYREVHTVQNGPQNHYKPD